MKREQYCFYCGEHLGFYDSHGESVSCGKKECERELRYQYEAELDERRYEAERDEYKRY